MAGRWPAGRDEGRTVDCASTRSDRLGCQSAVAKHRPFLQEQFRGRVITTDDDPAQSMPNEPSRLQRALPQNPTTLGMNFVKTPTLPTSASSSVMPREKWGSRRIRILAAVVSRFPARGRKTRASLDDEATRLLPEDRSLWLFRVAIPGPIGTRKPRRRLYMLES